MLRIGAREPDMHRILLAILLMATGSATAAATQMAFPIVSPWYCRPSAWLGDQRFHALTFKQQGSWPARLLSTSIDFAVKLLGACCLATLQTSAGRTLLSRRRRIAVHHLRHRRRRQALQDERRGGSHDGLVVERAMGRGGQLGHERVGHRQSLHPSPVSCALHCMWNILAQSEAVQQPLHNSQKGHTHRNKASTSRESVAKP